MNHLLQNANNGNSRFAKMLRNVNRHKNLITNQRPVVIIPGINPGEAFSNTTIVRSAPYDGTLVETKWADVADHSMKIASGAFVWNSTIFPQVRFNLSFISAVIDTIFTETLLLELLDAAGNAVSSYERVIEYVSTPSIPVSAFASYDVLSETYGGPFTSFNAIRTTSTVGGFDAASPSALSDTSSSVYYYTPSSPPLVGAR